MWRAIVVDAVQFAICFAYGYFLGKVDARRDK